MANWCSVKLTVKGETEEIEQFIAAQAGVEARYGESEASDLTPEESLKEFTFNAQVPVPPEVLKRGYRASGDDEGPDGNTWQSERWGTTKDATAVNIERGEGQAIIWMETAWSPPLAWFREVSELWSDLTMTIEFLEPLMPIAGTITVEEGEMVDYSELDVTAEFMREMGFSEEYIKEFFED